MRQWKEEDLIILTGNEKVAQCQMCRKYMSLGFQGSHLVTHHGLTHWPSIQKYTYKPRVLRK